MEELNLTPYEERLYIRCGNQQSTTRTAKLLLVITILFALMFSAMALLLDNPKLSGILMTVYIVVCMMDTIRFKHVCEAYRSLLRKLSDFLYENTGRLEYNDLSVQCDDGRFEQNMRSNTVLLSLFSIMTVLGITVDHFYVKYGTVIIQTILFIIFELIMLSIRGKVLSHIGELKATVFDLGKEYVRVTDSFNA